MSVYIGHLLVITIWFNFGFLFLVHFGLNNVVAEEIGDSDNAFYSEIFAALCCTIY
ncbi:hypothetical protein [Virgibacillus proomii]|uniref:hypothetical protein n=1 Tax=Virgibacillus proomii TaxID=84407 RepID=UPI0015C3793A|nr:hypothetical protein [Virgibacillus proomii]